MISSFPSRDQQPLFWLSGRPIHAVPFLIGLYLAATIGVALLLAAGRQDVIQLFVYNTTAVAHGQLWRLATYSLINPPSLWFALEIGMLYYFGRLVEAGIGSKSFALFYGGLILLQGILFQVAHFFKYPVEMEGIQMAGMALFAAFVTMMPSLSLFFGVAARWMLLLLLGLSALQLLAEHQWVAMGQLLLLSLAAVFYMKGRGYREALYFFSSNELEKVIKAALSKPVTLPPPARQAEEHRFTGSTLVASLPAESLKEPKAFPISPLQREAKKNNAMIHVDRLLDKINATGLSSLTDEEKEKLEAARLALLERDQKN